MKRHCRWIALSCVAACVLFAVPALAQTLTVSPDRLARYWLLTTTSLDADVPNTGRGLDAPGCAAVSYTIGSDGVPRDIEVRKVVPATSDFSSIAASVLRQFRYAPGADNTIQQPVRTYYVVPFNLAKTADGGKQLLRACVLPGY